MAKAEKPTIAAYEHRETFQFKGFTYRYDKPYGEWRRSERKAPNNLPRVIFSSRNETWRAGSAPDAETPLAALEIWLSSLIDLRGREAKEAEQHARALRAEVRELKARRWL